MDSKDDQIHIPDWGLGPREKTWQWLHRIGATPSSKKKQEAPLDIDAPDFQWGQSKTSARVFTSPQDVLRGPVEEREIYKMSDEEKVPNHPDEGHRWVSWAEKQEWQMQDLLDTLGAEYIGEKDLSDQPFIKANLPKRSSKQKKPSAHH